MTPALLFDLASVSKPFVALCAARLAQAKRLDVQAPLSSWLEEAETTLTGQVSLELLLSHRAGLLPHIELFAPLRHGGTIHRATALHRAARARRPDCQYPIGTGQEYPPCYSDLGYILAGEAMTRATGSPLDELVGREVCAPLGIEAGSARQWLRRRCDFASRVAPTELVDWRGGQLVGVVHDDNAWALHGHGLAGHAGLFATAVDVVRTGAAVLDAQAERLPDWLGSGDIEWLLRRRPDGSLRAGFDGKSGPESAAGRSSGPHTFGHLGFTGTSFWCDPDAGLVAVLLTNRVNPTRDHLAIRAARPKVHDALFEVARTLQKASLGVIKSNQDAGQRT